MYDDDDDDWCVHCGSEGCEGECRKKPVGESPGEHLERLAQENREGVHRAVQNLLEERLTPQDPNEKTLEDFEQELARRPKVELAQRRDGTSYRKRV